MLYSVINYSLILSLLPSLTSCHVFRMGECPEVKPMPIFNITRFFGEWYIVQKYGSTSDCVRENYTKIDDHLGIRMFVRKTSKPFGSLLKVLDGTVRFPMNRTDSEFWVDYSLSIGFYSPTKYVILATDYDNYALMWTCQKTYVGHVESAQIMARTPQLDRKIISKMRVLLISYNLNDRYFTTVKHNNCELPPSGDMPILSINGAVDYKRQKQSVNKMGIHVKKEPFH